MQVSIIIPIYNAEKYLQRCIESLLRQTYKNLEIILVDDGSTDGSFSICDDYSKKDFRIRVISSENCGQGAARNKGLDLATGRYISFVDADDVLKDDAIEMLLTIAEKDQFDIVAGSYFRVDKEVKISSSSYCSGKIERNGCKEDRKRYNLYKTTSSFGYVWGKLYRRAFLNKYKLRFSEERKVFMEDSLFNLKAFSFAPRYYVLTEPVYYYYIYRSSSSNRIEDITLQSLKMIYDYDNFLQYENKYQENLDLIIPLCARVFCWTVIKKVYARGFSFNNIYSTVIEFSESEPIRSLVSNKRAIRVLLDLPSLMEIVFFTICILALRYRLDRIISLIFLCICPFADFYIIRKVKG
jgi:glycosyltransferase involved in cell wall biosynthesis